MYWTPTNRNNTEPSGWGDLQLGILSPDRTISAPVALGFEPTIDGYVVNDSTWAHYTSFSRNIIFTNYAGSSVSGTIYAKTGVNDLYLALVISTNASVGDSLTLLQDYNAGTGGNVDYELTDDSENGAVITYTGVGTGSYTDRYFNIGPEWAIDAVQNGSGAVRHNGTSYEFECRIPLKVTGGYDLQITTGVLLGFNPKLLLKGSTFWWTAGTNSEWQRVRLDNNVYTSLGWAHLQTGAPIVQAVFPKDGDEVSGHYPFTIWATGAGGTTDISSATFSDDMGQSWKSLQQVGDTGFWTKTWDTTVLSDGSKEIRIKAIDKNGREATLTITVTVDNAQVTAEAPTVSINAPSAGEKVHGVVGINFTETPVSPKTVVSREISIDGNDVWYHISSTYTYLWDTTSLPDGAHIFRIRATDSQGITGYSDYRLVIVDNSMPCISNVTVEYPSGQTMAKRGDVVKISALVFDNSGINPSTVVLDATNLSGATYVMVDNGTSGDKVAGDNVYTYSVTVTTNVTGIVTFTITAADNEGNPATPVTGNIIVDNTAPVLASFTFSPIPKMINNNKEVYVNNIQLKFIVRDAIAGMGNVKIKLTNKNGDKTYYSEVLPADDGEVIQYIPLVEGLNRIYIDAVDKVGNIANVVADDIYYKVAKESLVITPRGGVVEGPDGTKVIVPEGALLEDTKISIKVVPKEELVKPTNRNIKLIGVARDFGPSGVVFNKPVTITIPYMWAAGKW
jgi:hypothetical protein